jgi:hypothetical protein
MSSGRCSETERHRNNPRPTGVEVRGGEVKAGEGVEVSCSGT